MNGSFSRYKLLFKLFLIRVIILFFRAVPFKRTFVQAVAVFIGTAQLLMSRGKWKGIAFYHEALGLRSRFFVFALRFNIRTIHDVIWGNIFAELPETGGSIVSSRGLGPLKQAIAGGKGAIMLGIHYGPQFYTYVLREFMGIDFRPVIQGATDMKKRHEAGLVDPELLNKRRRYLLEKVDFFIAGETELSLLKYIRGGGAVFMMNDIPHPFSGGIAADFLNRRVMFSYFPFKLAMKDDVPLFFCAMKQDVNGGYVVVFEKAEPLATIQDGLVRYLSFLDEHMRENPYMWNLGELMMNWTFEGSDDEMAGKAA